MTQARRTAAAVVLCAAVAAGCGIGPGEDSGEVELTVTRDFGSEQLLDESDSISESDTVMRLLDRNAEVETRYGGGFVQSVDGISGEESGGRSSDWFFYVDGVESPVGAAAYDLSDGERVWWDYHDWTAAMRVPAVVGSWPEPFVHGFQGGRYLTEVRCLRAGEACENVSERLEEAGAEIVLPFSETEPPAAEGVVPVLVGTWAKIRSDPDARLLASGPERSGVYATFSGGGRALLTLLSERAEPAGTLGHGGGLVAALRPGDRPPTWVVTGTDRAGVVAASRLLGDALADRFAVATEGTGEPIGVPVP